FFTATATTDIYTLSLHDALPIYLGGIHFQFRGENIHHAFDAMRSFGAARAAVRIGGHAIRKHADDVGANILRVVQPRHHQHAQLRNERRQQLVIRADVLNELQLDAEDSAVALGSDFVIIHVAASVGSAGE